MKEKMGWFWELNGEPTWMSQDLFLDFICNKDPTILHKFTLKTAFLSNETCKKAMQWKYSMKVNKGSLALKNLNLSKNQLAHSWIITAYQNNTLKVTTFSIIITCCWYNSKLSSIPKLMTALSRQKWQTRLTVFSNFFSVWGPQNVNCFRGLIF